MKDIFLYDQQNGKRIVAAAFGGDDFTADFGVFRSDDDRELDFARKMFAVTCHAFGITSIDTPYVQFKNQDGLKKELTYLNEIGMKAKFAIHPTQIDIINEAFCPTNEEFAYYQQMLAEFDKAQEEEGKAAITFKGKMVDIAAIRRAKETIEKYHQLRYLKS